MSPHRMCHTHFQEQLGTEPVQFHVTSIFSVTTPCSNYSEHVYTENCLSRCISSVTNVTSVTTTVTSTRDCHMQVLPLSLTSENINLFAKISPLTLHYWSNDVQGLVALETWRLTYTHHDEDWQVCLYFVCCDFFPLCVQQSTPMVEAGGNTLHSAGSPFLPDEP